MAKTEQFTPENFKEIIDKVQSLDIPEWVGVLVYSKKIIKESTMNELMYVINNIVQHT